MPSPFLFFAGERLSIAELTAACLDGLLVAIGEGYMPADAVETVWMRARSIAPLLGESLAGVRLTAAWVHGGALTEPSRHRVQRVTERRLHHVRNARFVYHDVRLDPADTATIAGVHVSSPSRTLVDLARSDDPIERATARDWARVDRDVAAAARAWLARHPRFPHARRASALLGVTTT